MENNKLVVTSKSSAFTTLESSSNSSCSSDGSATPKKRKYSNESQEKDGSSSYTSMIAQAIMKTTFKRATLSEIYNYMSNAFDILKKRGNGWRNCVRHTLSLNECFVKLNRPENGRSCNWTVHPSYFEAFLRGDYRKRRSNRKKLRDSQWMSDSRCGVNYPVPTNLAYLQNEQMNNLRQNEIDGMGQQGTMPPPSMWHSYVSALEGNLSKTSNSQDMSYAYHNMYNESMSTANKNSPVNPVCGTSSNHNVHLPPFSLTGYPMNSPSSTEYGEHHPAIIDNHGRARYSRSCGTTPTFPCKSNAGERLPYNVINRPPYGDHDQVPPPHFQFDSACYGNLSARPYRTEYF